MTSEQFFRAFLAALRTHDLEFVDTRNDVHHERFHRVVERLREAQDKDEDGARDMPLALVPSPFTGRYQEFDDALVKLQRGLLGSQNPFYPGIRMTLTEQRAEGILEQLPPTQRQLIDGLADAYLAEEHDAAAAHTD